MQTSYFDQTCNEFISHKHTPLSPINCQSVDNCCIITMTQFTCKGVKQINNRISLNMTFTFTIRISRRFSSAQEFQIIHVNLPAGAFFSRFWGSLPSLPSSFKIFRPWKKSSTKKSWPTFCDQYFWKFPIWNSCADEKRREIRIKVNVK
jgi:hypothetical protein